MKSRLHALYWVPSLYDSESYYDTFMAMKRDIALKNHRFRSKNSEPLKARISTPIMEGAPEEYIVNVAVEVVLGARGIRGIKIFFLGSVTRSVAVRSPKPVLVTRVPMSEKPEGMRVLLVAGGSAYPFSAGEFLL